MENVHTDYGDVSSSVRFRLSSRDSLLLYFQSSGGCFLIPETIHREPRSVTDFKKRFSVSVAIVPVLGPVEYNENLVQQQTVNRDQYTHRASRQFRSYWYYQETGEFQAFSDLVKETWPGMEIMPSERLGTFSPLLSMFCKENRIDRELFWAGFGFQVWCQMLTHVSRSTNRTLIVIDEPEIYLHPEIQHKLLSILRTVGPDVLIATHSTEIMSEADPSEILLIDKSRASAKRLRDIEGVQKALDIVGSVQVIGLTQLARSRKIVFVENESDFRVLSRFADRLGLSEISSTGQLTPIASGGFPPLARIKDAAWGVSLTLGTDLSIATIFDRDYRSDEERIEIQNELDSFLVFCHVHQRKEMENYLLVAGPLERALARAIAEQTNRTGIDIPSVRSIRDLLEEVTSDLETSTQGQYIGKRSEYFRNKGIDGATTATETIEWFQHRWRDIDRRLEIVPGKEVLRRLRSLVQASYSVTLTDYKIISAFRRDEIPEEIVDLLNRLELYRQEIRTD